MASNMFRNFISVIVLVLVIATLINAATTHYPISVDASCGNQCVETYSDISAYFKCIKKCWQGVTFKPIK